jgi:hypothetical protein
MSLSIPSGVGALVPRGTARRLTLLSVAVATILMPLAAQADPNTREPYPKSVASLGVAFGDPTAVDLKIWTGEGSGIDFGIGFNRFSERLGLYAEYELGLVDFWIGDSVRGIFYIGVGGAVALRYRNDDTSVALIIPIGLNFRFRAPVEVFVEGRPGLALLDKSGFGIGGQVGVRYVF